MNAVPPGIPMPVLTMRLGMDHPVVEEVPIAARAVRLRYDTRSTSRPRWWRNGERSNDEEAMTDPYTSAVFLL